MSLGRYKDFLYIALAVGALFGGLFLYTGVWPPAVVVESNSMMHVDPQEYNAGNGTTFGEDVGFGRLGTLDPGDLVLLKSVDSREDIQTFAHAEETAYGEKGDVIAFPASAQGRNLTVIHRAITYVEVRTEPDVRYVVEWTNEWQEPLGAQCARTPSYTCVFEGDRGISIPALGLFNLTVGRSGFLTKGDNLATNPGIDQAPTQGQAEALRSSPVRVNEIKGQAQGELPGLGLLKLAFTGDTVLNAQIQDHRYYLRIGNMVAPFDLWMVLVFELIASSVAPFAWTVVQDAWRGREVDRVPELAVLAEAWRDHRRLEADREPPRGE